MRIQEAKGTVGAVKLLAYVRENFETIPKFCEEKGLERIKVQKAIGGKLKRIDVDFATSIEKATDGAVVVPDWATPVLQ